MDQLTTELTHNEDNSWTLKLTGSVGPTTHALMWSAESSTLLLQKLVEAKSSKLFIDLTAVDRFDSHGLRLLLNAQKEFSAKSVQIVLKNPNSHLSRLFQIMQFDRAFEIEFDDRA